MPIGCPYIAPFRPILSTDTHCIPNGKAHSSLTIASPQIFVAAVVVAAAVPSTSVAVPPPSAVPSPPVENCIKIGLLGKSILRDYFQENRTSRRPFLLLRISFPGRPIVIQFIPVAAVVVVGPPVELVIVVVQVIVAAPPGVEPAVLLALVGVTLAISAS